MSSHSNKNYILLIEDEKFQAKLFSRIIQSEIRQYGYDVIIANNGNEAIEILTFDHRKNFIKLVLTDLSIYDISGYELIVKIKNLNQDLPIAILSAHEDEEIKKKVKELGVVDYFVKGKNGNELERLVKFIANMPINIEYS